MASNAITPHEGDALIVVDLQNDFLPGGALAVPGGDRVIAPLNHYIERFHRAHLPVVATRDWHPENHCSFFEQGGTWPPHCIAGTEGAAFADTLELPADAVIVSKADSPERDAYSGFQGTDLAERLRQMGVHRLFIGGLATDYCVLNTVMDALREAFEVFLLTDAIGAVEAESGDGEQAVEQMRAEGARPITTEDLS